MIDLILHFFSNYLIEFMGFLLASALTFRWLAYKASKYDDIYFTSFTRELQLNIDKDKEANVIRDDTDRYLSDILGRVSSRLPKRGLRFTTKTQKEEKVSPLSEKDSAGSFKISSLRDYVGGKQGLISSIQSEGSVFHCKTPPNFNELSSRILGNDIHWKKLFGHIPIDGVTRMIDTLPGLFIVFGVFGTFIGISMALPEIANIDFNDLEGSGQTLTAFVISVTFAMKTSIAGIFFSLVLTFLNTLFPIREKRLSIFKKIETCIQNLWYHIHSNQSSETVLIRLVPDLLETMKNINKVLSEDIGRPSSKKEAA